MGVHAMEEGSETAELLHIFRVEVAERVVKVIIMRLEPVLACRLWNLGGQHNQQFNLPGTLDLDLTQPVARRAEELPLRVLTSTGVSSRPLASARTDTAAGDAASAAAHTP